MLFDFFLITKQKVGKHSSIVLGRSSEQEANDHKTRLVVVVGGGGGGQATKRRRRSLFGICGWRQKASRQRWCGWRQGGLERSDHSRGGRHGPGDGGGEGGGVAGRRVCGQLGQLELEGAAGGSRDHSHAREAHAERRGAVSGACAHGGEEARLQGRSLPGAQAAARARRRPRRHGLQVQHAIGLVLPGRDRRQARRRQVLAAGQGGARQNSRPLLARLRGRSDRARHIRGQEPQEPGERAPLARTSHQGVRLSGNHRNLRNLSNQPKANDSFCCCVHSGRRHEALADARQVGAAEQQRGGALGLHSAHQHAVHVRGRRCLPLALRPGEARAARTTRRRDRQDQEPASRTAHARSLRAKAGRRWWRWRRRRCSGSGGRRRRPGRGAAEARGAVAARRHQRAVERRSRRAAQRQELEGATGGAGEARDTAPRQQVHRAQSQRAAHSPQQAHVRHEQDTGHDGAAHQRTPRRGARLAGPATRGRARARHDPGAERQQGHAAQGGRAGAHQLVRSLWRRGAVPRERAARREHAGGHQPEHQVGAVRLAGADIAQVQAGQDDAAGRAQGHLAQRVRLRRGPQSGGEDARPRAHRASHGPRGHQRHAARHAEGQARLGRRHPAAAREGQGRARRQGATTTCTHTSSRSARLNGCQECHHHQVGNDEQVDRLFSKLTQKCVFYI